MLPLLLLVAQLVAPTGLTARVVPLTSPAVPTTATVVTNIQALAGWSAATDIGSTEGSTSLAGLIRSFQTTGVGDERYWVSFGSDEQATNFEYDATVTVGPGVQNLEMDMNQVLSDGDTVIYGFQCDGYSGTWDYTANTGTPINYVDTWVHSQQTCNPKSLQGTHHIQVTYSRVGEEVVYKSVWVDGVEQDINATVLSGFTLGWGSVLLTNFEVDQLGGATTTALDSLRIARW